MAINLTLCPALLLAFPHFFNGGGDDTPECGGGCIAGLRRRLFQASSARRGSEVHPLAIPADSKTYTASRTEERELLPSSSIDLYEGEGDFDDDAKLLDLQAVEGAAHSQSPARGPSPSSPSIKSGECHLNHHHIPLVFSVSCACSCPPLVHRSRRASVITIKFHWSSRACMLLPSPCVHIIAITPPLFSCYCLLLPPTLCSHHHHHAPTLLVLFCLLLPSTLCSHHHHHAPTLLVLFCLLLPPTLCSHHHHHAPTLLVLFCLLLPSTLCSHHHHHAPTLLVLFCLPLPSTLCSHHHHHAPTLLVLLCLLLPPTLCARPLRANAHRSRPCSRS
jgi:hypothetical protein